MTTARDYGFRAWRLAPSRNDAVIAGSPLTSSVVPSIYASPGRVRAFGVRRAHDPGKAATGFPKGSCVEYWITMTQRSSEGLDVRRRRLLFRAWRRGVREMDLIIGRFADANIEAFDDAGLDDFERLIEAPNVDLFAWVTGSAVVPAPYDTAVMARLRAFHMRSDKAVAKAEEQE